MNAPDADRFMLDIPPRLGYLRNMPTLKERILSTVKTTPGLTDREVTDRLFGAEYGQQTVNQAARALEASGYISRNPRPDGKIGNYPDASPSHQRRSETGRGGRSGASDMQGMSEDQVKRCVMCWLETNGWRVRVKWGRDPGIDIEATRDSTRWVIEAKGCGSRQQMRLNYFLMVLGETLQRMDEESARYSIAVPDTEQFRRLWSLLPQVAKSRTRISILLVTNAGQVDELV